MLDQGLSLNRECHRLYSDRIQGVKGADALVICTRVERASQRRFHLAEKRVIDGRNLYTPAAVEEPGFVT